MTKYLALVSFLFSLSTLAAETSPLSTPIFLRLGYSSILDFDEPATQVVLGDRQSFQVERLKNSVVIRPLVEEASSNMFVYFKRQDPQLFILTVSDDAEPTLYRKVESIKFAAPPKPNQTKPAARYKRATRLVRSDFDGKKDFLILEIAMTADSTDIISPLWNEIRLSFDNKQIKPTKTWSERQIVQKDSRVIARFTFKRPNVPRDLKGTKLLIPLKGHKSPVLLTLAKGTK